jgi:nitroimidazol reductase NimA-like FMN-containing flavoprotein (pyridoxamine 5'-phosphate oxidase superfamily)
MQNDDEPVLGKRGGGPAPEDPRSLAERIKALVDTEPYAVLCTQGEGQPYASLVAFAFTEDLHTAVFVTPMATRKYKLLVDCVRVALLVDNRPSHPDDMMKVEAVTATGRASEIARGPVFEQRAALLLRKHSYLEAFVRAESCALFTIDITRFFHVSRFQEVQQWVPERV